MDIGSITGKANSTAVIEKSSGEGLHLGRVVAQTSM
jgi:hypothetical protein